MDERLTGPVTKLLVANRGEIACRIVRSARAMGIATVAVASDPDASAAHADAADEVVALPGARAADTYLAVDRIIAAAIRSGADAVHPGYGFLAESATFAQACVDAGLTFVGPAPEVIAAMGDKLRAKETMRRAGVAVLDAVAVGDRPVDEVQAADLSYPLMVKPAAGGGGKGIRVVRERAALAEAVAASRREAAGAFDDDRVFVEPFLHQPRHVEVQVLGDAHGTVLHLGERECSVQRRHQKVIEEAPSPAVDPGLRERLCRAAVDAARAIGYTSAGTVEFILDTDGGFWFLEVNTRLQVEHPVTELAWSRVDGRPLDLVALQLSVARGEPLPFAQEGVALSRHAVEARVYAEDPAAGDLPSTGRLHVWEPAADGGVRWDSGVRAGDEIGIHYDPLLAKAIAGGASRGEAIDRLSRALAMTRVHGVATNRDVLVAVLRHPEFRAGRLHTGFLEEHRPAPAATRHERHAVAAALAAMRRRHRSAAVMRTIPPGWRNNPSQPQQVAYLADGAVLEVAYARRRDGNWDVVVDAAARAAHVVRVLGWPDQRPDGAIDIDIDGLRTRCRVDELDGVVAVDSAWGHSGFEEIPRYPEHEPETVAGALVAPMPGTIVSVAARAGETILAGDPLLVVEAMKMEHAITAPHAGTIERVEVSAGDQVATGDVLVVVSEEPA